MFKKLINEKDDDNFELVINKFDDENDFISFEDKHKNESTLNANNAKYENLHTNYLINNEFNSKNFFDRMNNERDFQTLYS
jgi:hypothetical protein